MVPVAIKALVRDLMADGLVGVQIDAESCWMTLLYVDLAEMPGAPRDKSH